MSKFNVQVAQIQPGREVPRKAPPRSSIPANGEPARLRVFSQQERLIAIAEAVVPRTYQPLVDLEAEA